MRAGDAAARGPGPALGNLVLPRFLRKPARWWLKAVSGEIGAPPFAVTAMTAAFLGCTGIYGSYAGGHLPSIIEALASRSGFAVDDIRISGNERISEIDVIDTLGLDGSTSLIGLSAADARDRIASLPWAARVSVRKSYPSTIEIDIAERVPFAIWQSGSQLSLIERDGDVITAYPGPEFATLPLVIGMGAAEEADEIIAAVRAYPEMAARIKAYIRIADRRWDLRFENGITVKLPDQGETQALADLAGLDRSDGILSRDIAAVDFRLADRIVVRLTPEAAVRRAEFVAERARKRPERGI